MKVINKLIKIIDKLINLIVSVVLILFFFFGGYAILDAYTVYDSAKLSDDIINLKPKDYIESDGKKAEEKFSFEPLYEINKDICAWIRIFNTNIDYPVVIGKDNTEYINRDYKKEYATSGSIFLDYRNNRDFNDDYSIIYGHNMKSGAMFSDIKKFENPEFFESHESGILYTEKNIYKLDVICVAKVNAFSNETYNLIVYKNGKKDELINMISNKAIFNRKLEHKENEKLLLLSTCSSSGSSERLVLLVRLCNSNGENLEIDNSINNEVVKEESQNIDDNSEENKVSKSIEKNEEKKKFSLNISTRSLAIIILSIIVVIIFIIVIIQRIILILKKSNKDKEEK